MSSEYMVQVCDARPKGASRAGNSRYMNSPMPVTKIIANISS